MPNSGPADTLTFYIAGYVVFFAVSLIYLASLFIRRRSLTQDLRTLEEVDQKSGGPAGPGEGQSRADAGDTSHNR